MAETIFIAAGWTLLVAGVVVAWRYGWRDTGKGTRRCSKCWYDMAATAGLKCPECGKEFTSESRLFRARRKWGWMAAGLVLVLASYPILKWPSYQKAGIIGFVPRVMTLALLPEMSNLVREYAPRGTPSGEMLAFKLSQFQPFNRVERYALARSLRRMLFKQLSAHSGVNGLSGIGLLGDQTGEIVDPLVALFANESTAGMAMNVASNLPRVRDDRFGRLIAPVIAEVKKGTTRPGIPQELIDRMRWWGASVEDRRTVAAYFLRAAQASDNNANFLESVWRNDCVPSRDLCALEKQLAATSLRTSTFAALCLADLGSAADPVLDDVTNSSSRPTSTFVNSVAIPLMASGSSASHGLPWLDRLSSHRNPLIASSAFLAALSIRGDADAAYMYWVACIDDDSEVNADAPPHQWMTPLILYADVPVDWKAEGLVRAIKRDQRLAARTPAGVSGGVSIAVDCLGKLGGAAVRSVPELIDLIEPGVPDFLVERVLDALTKIRSSSDFDIRPVEKTVDRWLLTAPGCWGVESAMADLKDAASRRIP